MKIDFAKLFRIITQVVAIAPTIFATVKPLVEEVTKRRPSAQ